jgi:hypothetical protein
MSEYNNSFMGGTGNSEPGMLLEKDMSIRCKFVCSEAGKRQGWDKEHPILHHATLIPVSNGSDENRKFFKATPSGKFEVSSIIPDAFEVGKEYYIDISPVA